MGWKENTEKQCQQGMGTNIKLTALKPTNCQRQTKYLHGSGLALAQTRNAQSKGSQITTMNLSTVNNNL